MRSSSAARNAGPSVDDADHEPVADHAGPHPDGVTSRVAAGILEQVDEGSLDLGGVELDQGDVAVDREREIRPPSPTSSTAVRTSSSIEDQSRRGSRGPRLETGEVEKLVDEA